jgi:hypothetical protein
VPLGDVLLVPAEPLVEGGGLAPPGAPLAGPCIPLELPAPAVDDGLELVPEAVPDDDGAVAADLLPPELFWLDFEEPELSHAARDKAERTAAAISQFLFISLSP